MRTLNPEGVNNFLYDATGTTNLDIQMAHWTVFVHYKPVFNAQFTVKLVAVITFLGVSTYLEADLAKQVVCERLIDLESGNCVCIVAQI